MKINRTIKAEQDIRYLRATMGVRYWVDCQYSEDNGNSWNLNFPDTDEASAEVMKHIPCVVRKDIGYRENNYWELLIDLDEGKVVNWKEGFRISTWFKVCDDGEYVFLDENMNEVINITKEYEQYYVPDFLEIGDEGYGDYVYLDIDGDGNIKDFDTMKKEIIMFFMDNDCEGC